MINFQNSTIHSTVATTNHATNTIRSLSEQELHQVSGGLIEEGVILAVFTGLFLIDKGLFDPVFDWDKGEFIIPER